MLSTVYRRVIGLLTLGGSAFGLAVLFQTAVGSQMVAVLWAIFAVFALIYAYGIVSGMFILEGHDRGRLMAIPFWIIQIPVLQSTAVTYQLGTGVFFNLVVGASGRVNFDFQFGSEFQFWLLQPSEFQIGLNFAAIFVAYTLIKPSEPQAAIEEGASDDPL